MGARVAVKDLFAIAGERIGAGNPRWLAGAAPQPRTATAGPLARDPGLLRRAAAVLLPGEDAVGTTSPGYCLQATLCNVRQCFGFTARAAGIGTAAAHLQLRADGPARDGRWPGSRR